MTNQTLDTSLTRYGDFRPTAMDSRGLALPDRQDWLVCPVSRTRDSDTLTESNWATQLALLGGESETVEIHRFGHWGPGWFEITLIDPADTARVDTVEQKVYHALNCYPVLDDDDYSSREHEEYLNSWGHGCCSDFRKLIVEKFELADETAYRMDDIEPDTLREWYESLTPSGDYYADNGMCSRLKYAVQALTRSVLAKWLRTHKVARTKVVA